MPVQVSRWSCRPGELDLARVERTAGAVVQLGGAGGVAGVFEHRPQPEFIAVPRRELHTRQRRAVRTGLRIQPAGEVPLSSMSLVGSANGGELPGRGQYLGAGLVQVVLAQHPGGGPVTQHWVQAGEPGLHHRRMVPLSQQDRGLVAHPRNRDRSRPRPMLRVPSAHCRTARVSRTPPR